MLQSSKYYILQLLLNEEFRGNCVLPIKNQVSFTKIYGQFWPLIYVLEIYIREGWGLMKRSYV